MLLTLSRRRRFPLGFSEPNRYREAGMWISIYYAAAFAVCTLTVP